MTVSFMWAWKRAPCLLSIRITSIGSQPCQNRWLKSLCQQPGGENLFGTARGVFGTGIHGFPVPARGPPNVFALLNFFLQGLNLGGFVNYFFPGEFFPPGKPAGSNLHRLYAPARN